MQYNINSEEATSQQPKKERVIQLNRTYLKKTHVKTHRYMVTQTYLLRDPEDLAENSHLKKTRFSTKRLKLEGESEKMERLTLMFDEVNIWILESRFWLQYPSLNPY